jgi:hypothetical protein
VTGLLTLPVIAALAAGAVASLALIVVGVLWVRVKRLRRAQSVVLGGQEQRDLVAHAERIERGFVDLREWMEEAMHRWGDRLERAEGRLDGAIAHRALVRYDAYGEMSGRQSSSIALLDSNRSGIVVSSILHRDQARIYAKQVHQGQSEHELSPEEAEAIELALSQTSVSRAL